MSRLRSNCMVIDVRPDELLDVIWVTPETMDKEVSSGVATVVAIVSALAPGKLAEIWMVGKSTCGNEATGNAMYAMEPSKIIPTASRLVPPRRRMKTSEMLILPPPRFQPSRHP